MKDRIHLDIEEACILLIVLREPTHGYQVVKILEERGLLSKSPTQVYRKLRDMEKEGLLECSWEVSEGKRPRKVYRLSDQGRRFLEHCGRHTLAFLENARQFMRENLDLREKEV